MAEQWFYTSKGKEMGPVPAAELKQMAASGSLKPTDMVWREGMANWVRAGTNPSLFPQAGAVTARGRRAGPWRAALQTRTATTILKTRGPGGHARRDPDRDDDEDDDRPRRRRRASGGTPPGLVLGLVAGGLVLVGLIVGFIFLLARGTADNEVPVAAAGNNNGVVPGAGVIMTYTVEVQVQGQDIRPINLLAGRRYEFSLKAANQAGDVDMYIMNVQGQDLAMDEGLAADAFIDFTAPYSGIFRIDVFNVGPMPNRATITVTDKGQSANPPNQVIIRPGNKAPPFPNAPFPNAPFPKAPFPKAPFPVPPVNMPPQKAAAPAVRIIPGDMFPFIKTAVKDNRLTDVDITGFKVGNNFYRDAFEEGGILVGFEVGMGKFVNNDTVNALRPIYLTGSGEKMGAWHGSPPAKSITVKAKPGYVVGGLNVRAALHIDGLSLTFMKLANDRLQPSDTYASTWVGGQGGSPHTVGGQGYFFVGVCGNLNNRNAPCSIGLIAVQESK